MEGVHVHATSSSRARVGRSTPSRDSCCPRAGGCGARSAAAGPGATHDRRNLDPHPDRHGHGHGHGDAYAYAYTNAHSDSAAHSDSVRYGNTGAAAAAGAAGERRPAADQRTGPVDAARVDAVSDGHQITLPVPVPHASALADGHPDAEPDTQPDTDADPHTDTDGDAVAVADTDAHSPGIGTDHRGPGGRQFRRRQHHGIRHPRSRPRGPAVLPLRYGVRRRRRR